MLVLNSVRAAASRSARRRPEHLVGFYSSGRPDRNQLQWIPANLSVDGFGELICRPARDETGDERHDWGYRWRDERDAFMAPEVRAEIAKGGVRRRVP
jgi:hypothetical protein